jgi:hypothetical protein
MPPLRPSPRFCRTALAALLLAVAPALRAWDYAGHRLVNQLALAGLPADFPVFARAPDAAERIAYLSGEPDRWRNVADLPLRHANGPDHYLDLELLPAAGLDPATVSPLRYEFAAQFAVGRAAHPGNFPAPDPAKDADHTQAWPGFLPWAITEHFLRLKSAFATLRAFEEAGGTPAEIANARADVIYLMGVMGHYVGDSAQPLHATIHHHGWVGANPDGYSVASTFHAWIDGGFLAQSGLSPADVLPRARAAKPFAAAAPGARDAVFDAVMRHLAAQNARVAPLYALDLTGQLKAGAPAAETAAGRAFLTEQLLRGGELLSSLWLTAWRDAPADTFLRNQLARRAAGAEARPEK